MIHLFDFPMRLSATRESSPESMNNAVTSATDLHLIPVEKVDVQPGSRIVYHTEPHSAAADRFRFLRMVLREIWNTGRLKSLLITSPLAQDGKSTIALNLATALTERGKRSVLVIEADLHHPTLSGRLNISNRPGLAECLETGLDPVSAIRRLDPLGWYFLPAGSPLLNPTELLQDDGLPDLMKRLSHLFDWILIDSPPVIPLTDAVTLARQASATLLIAREGRTPRHDLERTIALLGRQRVLGVILNGIEGLDRIYSGYYSGNRSENKKLTLNT